MSAPSIVTRALVAARELEQRREASLTPAATLLRDLAIEIERLHRFLYA
jgi:hypothetical protein